MFSTEYFVKCLSASIRLIPQNLLMTALVLAICVVLGTGIAMLRTYRVPVLDVVCDVLMAVCKVLPANLVLLITFILFTGNFKRVAAALGLHITIREFNMLYVAVAALVVCSISGISEMIRSGLMSVGRNQYEAGYSVGLTKAQTFFRIIAPQAVRNIIPPLTNSVLSLMKSTALVSVIGVSDILTGATGAAADSYAYLEAYIAAALVFWVIGLLLELVSGCVERYYAKRIRG